MKTKVRMFLNLAGELKIGLVNKAEHLKMELIASPRIGALM